MIASVGYKDKFHMIYCHPFWMPKAVEKQKRNTKLGTI
jgi:hypothetical protein